MDKRGKGLRPCYDAGACAPESTGLSSSNSRSSRKLYPVHRKVIDYLCEHPEAHDLPRAELARLAGISSAGMASEGGVVQENPLPSQAPGSNEHSG